MNSLTIQDDFAPYYAGRKPFAVLQDGRVEAMKLRAAAKVPPVRTPAAPRSAGSDGETEH